MNETIGKLFDGYGYTFCHAEDIGKFQVDEAYTFGFNDCQNLFTPGLILLLRHSSTSSLRVISVVKFISPLYAFRNAAAAACSSECKEVLKVRNIIADCAVFCSC